MFARFAGAVPTGGRRPRQEKKHVERAETEGEHEGGPRQRKTQITIKRQSKRNRNVRYNENEKYNDKQKGESEL